MGKISDQLTPKGSKATWYPASISALEEHLGAFIVHKSQDSVQNVRPLKKNLAYNLQYIEFIDRLIKDINLSSVLWTQNVKSFVLHSAAVIEGIFDYLLSSTGHAAKTEWQPYIKLKSNQYDINCKTFINETEIFIHLDHPKSIKMTFDQMAKKVEAKKLIGPGGDLYKEISKIRKLRNKIHLHGIESPNDTDYANFNESEYQLARRVLYRVLVSPLFTGSKHHDKFEYLDEG